MWDEMHNKEVQSSSLIKVDTTAYCSLGSTELTFMVFRCDHMNNKKGLHFLKTCKKL